jgi:putative endonuclease
LVICEVKTRSSDDFGSPAHAVTPTKRRRLRELAVAWMHEQDRRFSEVRFDVAQVVGPHLEVIEGAF